MTTVIGCPSSAGHNTLHPHRSAAAATFDYHQQTHRMLSLVMSSLHQATLWLFRGETRSHAPSSSRGKGLILATWLEVGRMLSSSSMRMHAGLLASDSTSRSLKRPAAGKLHRFQGKELRSIIRRPQCGITNDALKCVRHPSFRPCRCSGKQGLAFTCDLLV